MTNDKLIEIDYTPIISDAGKSGFPAEVLSDSNLNKLAKFAELTRQRAITSMQTEQPLTREEITAIAEKAGAYVRGDYPALINGNHEVKIFDYTKKVIELARCTNPDGWVLSLVGDEENRTYKFYSEKNALNAQQDWLEQGIKSTISPAPVTSMQGDSEYSLVRNDVLAFLHGEGDIDGVGFGDVIDAHEGVKPKLGKYWWRKYLRDATKPVVDDRVKGVSDSKAINNAIEFLKYLNTSGLLTGDDKLRKSLVREMEKSYKELSAIQLPATDSYQLHEIFGSIEECPPILKTDSFIVRNVKNMAQLINSLSTNTDGAVLVTQDTFDYLTQQSAKYNAINTPEIQDFIKAIELEALHQRDRWGAEGDAGKSDTDWFWLIGYLAGKAINKPEKALHHIITTAAACLNWHGAKTGNYTVMRPGINAISQPKGE